MASVFSSFELFSKISQNLNMSFRLSDAVRQMNQQSVAAIAAASSVAVNSVAQEMAKRNYHLMRSLDLKVLRLFPENEVMNALNIQWDAIAKITQSYQTAQITALKNCLFMNDFIGGIEAFMPALMGNIIEAPNLVFLREAALFSGSLSPAIPRGIKSIVKEMHAGTAKRLALSEDVSLNLSHKCFFTEASPDNMASVKETNIICSAIGILRDFTETELMDFMNYTAKFPEFASSHHIGQRIFNAIRDWNEPIDFDATTYYHARSLMKDACPYTEAQLLKAPSGVTWHGRFNHIGESHYYFSDKSIGAVLEVKKHAPKDCKIQVAKLRPKRKIAMIDLSGTNQQNKFLEYCRFAPANDDYSNIKREYLIPCFVASCCKQHNIDGIRYYGSQEYRNYVAWSDHYFDCVEFHLE